MLPLDKQFWFELGVVWDAGKSLHPSKFLEQSTPPFKKVEVKCKLVENV